MTLDEIIWWTGAAVIAAGGFALAAALVVALLAGGSKAIRYWYDMAKMSHRDADDLTSWCLAGRPRWQRVEMPDGGRMYRMLPSDGPWEDADGLTGGGEGETL